MHSSIRVAIDVHLVQVLYLYIYIYIAMPFLSIIPKRSHKPLEYLIADALVL